MSRCLLVGGGAVAACLLIALLGRKKAEKEADPAFVAGKYGLGLHAAASLRWAERADVPAIRRLIVELAVYEKEPASVVEVTEQELLRDGFGPRAVYRCLLAEIGGETVGLALVHYSYSTWQGRCLYLEDLVVSAPHRGKGIGGLLLKTVAAVAQAEGCKRLHWGAFDWNSNALEFYDKCGANRETGWANLRMERPAIDALLAMD
jgi:GNAT superfamily N-acetyltransferase